MACNVSKHHDQTAFAKDVRCLVDVFEDFGNPFEEGGIDLLDLDTKEIIDHAAVESVKKARRIGQEQLEAFTNECIVNFDLLLLCAHGSSKVLIGVNHFLELA